MWLLKSSSVENKNSTRSNSFESECYSYFLLFWRRAPHISTPKKQSVFVDTICWKCVVVSVKVERMLHKRKRPTIWIVKDVFIFDQVPPLPKEGFREECKNGSCYRTAPQKKREDNHLLSFFCGAGGSRTPVQTVCLKAFYTLSHRLILLLQPGEWQPNHSPSFWIFALRSKHPASYLLIDDTP